jgi:putative sigma-54 modulation protein
MKYEFTGRHTTVTPALKRHAREHLDKLDQILDSAPMKAHIVLDVEKQRHSCEIIVFWRDHTFTSRVATKDMYDSITQASDKIQKQAFKLKDRFDKGKRQKLSTSEATALPAESAPVGDDTPRIVRARRYTIKPMTPEEAAGQLADSADQFVVFRDAESSRLGVLYKRKNGDYGLIEP